MLNLQEIDLTAGSKLAGALSIACWICVFIPQILANWKNGSTEGLSFTFLCLWLAGDLFNIVGSVLQHVLLTMLIVAIYYTVADAVIVGQFFYFNGIRLNGVVGTAPVNAKSSCESSPVSSTHALGGKENGRVRRIAWLWDWLDHVCARLPKAPESRILSAARDLGIVLLVCAAGFVGWLLAADPGDFVAVDPEAVRGTLQFDIPGQVLGWLCCVLYLGSRVPQLWMNYRRQSTDGLSHLLFVFALLGNSTYVASIFLYQTPCWDLRLDICRPEEAEAVYARYILVNLSWVLGSTVTILMDLGILLQHLWYQRKGNHHTGAVSPV